MSKQSFFRSFRQSPMYPVDEPQDNILDQSLNKYLVKEDESIPIGLDETEQTKFRVVTSRDSNSQESSIKLKTKRSLDILHKETEEEKLEGISQTLHDHDDHHTAIYKQNDHEKLLITHSGAEESLSQQLKPKINQIVQAQFQTSKLSATPSSDSLWLSFDESNEANKIMPKCTNGHICKEHRSKFNWVDGKYKNPYFDQYQYDASIYCNVCQVYSLQAHKYAYHCYECGTYDLCRSCALKVSDKLKVPDSVKFPFFNLEFTRKQKDPDQLSCISKFFTDNKISFPGVPTAWMKCCNEGQELNSYEKTLGFFGKTWLFVCTECAIKWSQFNWDPNFDYLSWTIDNLRSLIPEFHESKTVRSQEEDNKILSMENGDPKQKFDYFFKEYLKNHHLKRCNEKIVPFQYYHVKEEDIKKGIAYDGFKWEPNSTNNPNLTNIKRNLRLYKYDTAYRPVVFSREQHSRIYNDSEGNQLSDYRGVNVLNIFKEDNDLILEKQIIVDMTNDFLPFGYLAIRFPSVLQYKNYIYFYKRFREFKDSSCSKSTLRLFRLDLKTLQEIELEGFSIEDNVKHEHNILFNIPYSELYIVMWINKKIDKNNIQKKCFDSLEKADRFANLEFQDENVPAFIVVDPNTFEIKTYSFRIGWEDYDLIFRECLKDGFTLKSNHSNGQDYLSNLEKDAQVAQEEASPLNKKGDDPVDEPNEEEKEQKETNLEKKDEKEKEVQAKEELDVQELEFLNNQYILFDDPVDHETYSYDEKVKALGKDKISIFKLSDLKNPISQISPIRCYPFQFFFRRNLLKHGTQIEQSSQLNLQPDGQSKQENTICTPAIEFTLLNTDTYQFLYYPSDKDLNETEEKQKVDQKSAEMSQEVVKEDELNLRFKQITPNLMYFKGQQYPSELDPPYSDIQSIQIKLKLPGQALEKVWNQHFIIAQSYNFQTALVSPYFDPDYFYSEQEAQQLLQKFKKQNTQTKLSVNDMIIKLIRKQLCTQEEFENETWMYQMNYITEVQDKLFGQTLIYKSNLATSLGFYARDQINSISSDKVTYLATTRYGSTVISCPSASYYGDFIGYFKYSNHSDQIQQFINLQEVENLNTAPQIFRRIQSLDIFQKEKCQKYFELNKIQKNISIYYKNSGQNLTTYLNSKFSNVFYTSQDVYTVIKDKNVTFSISEIENCSNDILIESPSRNDGTFSKIKLINFSPKDVDNGVTKVEDIKIQEKNQQEKTEYEKTVQAVAEEVVHTPTVLCIMRSQNNYIFCLSINFGNQFYFFVVLNEDEVIHLENRKERALITKNTQIRLIQLDQSKASVNIQMTRQTFGDFYKKFAKAEYKDDLDMNLTFNSFIDFRVKSSILPFIVYGLKGTKSLSLCITDFDDPDLPIHHLSIKPKQKIIDQIDQTFTQIVQSSEQKVTDKNYLITKYSILLKYYNRYSGFQINEFAVLQNIKNKSISIKQSGIREIIASDTYNNSSYWDHFRMFPIFNKRQEIEGLQVIRRSIYYYETQHCATFLFYDEKHISQQYQYSTNLAHIGHKLLYPQIEMDPDYYYLSIVATLKESTLCLDLDNFQCRSILDEYLYQILSMVPFNFDYSLRSNFSLELGESHYFIPQEPLLGKSISDLFLNDFKQFSNILNFDHSKTKANFKQIIHLLKPGNFNDSHYQDFINQGIYRNLPFLSQDFNLVNQLQRLYDMKHTKTAEMFLKFLIKKNNPEYINPIMRILPTILQSNTTPLFPFLHQSIEDDETQLCMILEKLSDQNLPNLSKEPYMSLKFKNLYDPFNYINEVVEIINEQQINLNQNKSVETNQYNDFEDQVKQYLEKDQQNIILKQEDEIFEVEHSIIDFRSTIFGLKLASINKNQPMVKFDNFYVAKMINSVNNEEFYDQTFIKLIIDFQFKRTKILGQFAFWFYLLFFILPMMIVLFLRTTIVLEDATTSDEWIKVLFIIALIPQIFFIFVEMVQIGEQKWDYIKNNYWNFFDFFQFFIFLAIFVANLTMNTQEIQQIQARSVLTSILILFAFFKVLYFIRIYESYGFLVQMVQMTVQGVIPFTVFLGMWIVMFACIYKSLRIQVEPDPNANDLQYPGVPDFIKFFLVAYRNSIGDISAPDYTLWLGQDENNNKLDYTSQQAIINWIWIVWFINQFVNLIILLNFLIAVISQVYEKVISKSRIFNQIHKAQLNMEFYQITNFFGLNSPLELLVFQQIKENYKQEEDEWQGLFMSIKSHIDGRILKLRQKIEEQNEATSELVKKEIANVLQTQLQENAQIKRDIGLLHNTLLEVLKSKNLKV